MDETNNKYLTYIPREEFEKSYPSVNTTTDVGAPLLWTDIQTTSDRDMQIRVYPVPDTTLTLRVWYYFEPLELTNDTDIPRIPDQFHYGLTYLAIAKYFEFNKEPFASYYRNLHESWKNRMLTGEFGNQDEMPQIQPMRRNKGYITGKLGREYN